MHARDSNGLGRLTRRRLLFGMGLAAAGVGLMPPVTWARGAFGAGALTEPTATNALLERAPWKLLRYLDPGGAAQPVLPGTEITADFRSGRLAGSSGCNRYTAPYTLDGNTIAIATGSAAASPATSRRSTRRSSPSSRNRDGRASARQRDFAKRPAET